MSAARFSIGDRVVVRQEYRRLFNVGSRAARGDVLTVHERLTDHIPTALSGSHQIQIGPGPLDYANDWELQLASDVIACEAGGAR